MTTVVRMCVSLFYSIQARPHLKMLSLSTLLRQNKGITYETNENIFTPLLDFIFFEHQGLTLSSLLIYIFSDWIFHLKNYDFYSTNCMNNLIRLSNGNQTFSR